MYLRETRRKNRDGSTVSYLQLAHNERNAETGSPTAKDTKIIRTVKDDLDGWNLRRLVWVADRGFASATNRAYVTRGGGHYIHAEKLRHTNTNTEAAAALARPGRYRTVAGNLRVWEVHVAPDGDGDGASDGVRGAGAQRFVVCHNPEAAERDATVRANL